MKNLNQYIKESILDVDDLIDKEILSLDDIADYLHHPVKDLDLALENFKMLKHILAGYGKEVKNPKPSPGKCYIALIDAKNSIYIALILCGSTKQYLMSYYSASKDKIYGGKFGYVYASKHDSEIEFDKYFLRDSEIIYYNVPRKIYDKLNYI